MAAIHVAIIDSYSAATLIEGRKRVESRFMRHRRIPYGYIKVGDMVYFKLTGAFIIGHCRVARVQEFCDLTPRAMEALRVQFNWAIQGPPTYWNARRCCRYGVLIWLRRFVPKPAALQIPRQYGNGWLVLDKARRAFCPIGGLAFERGRLY